VVHTGLYTNNEWSGEGQVTFTDGREYHGTLNEGKLEGVGTMYYTDGSKYTGHWYRNKKHGEGSFTDKNGVAKTR